MNGAGKMAGKGLKAASVSVVAVALSACVSVRGERLAVSEEPVLIGPAVRDNRTPMDGALTCYADHLAAAGKPRLVIGVGDVRDYTGKYAVAEGNAITQGGALMVYSALGKLRGSVALAERFDPTIAERELGYTDRRQLGDGRVHEIGGASGAERVPWLPYYGGTIAASDYFIVGGITELNYDIRSGGVQVAVNSVGPKTRTYTQSVAVDLRIVNTRTLLVEGTISLTKQFAGYETGFGVFRFFGSDLFDINVGAKGQEPLQLGIRTALEEATMRLLAGVTRIDPNPCMTQRSWAAATELSDASASRRPPGATEPVTVPTASIIPGKAINGVSASASGADAALAVPFDIGSSELTGGSVSLVERIAAAAAKGPVELTIVARDTEKLDANQRDGLSDRRIAALLAALKARGVDPDTVRLIWRPKPSDTALHRSGPGLQLVARLRIG